MNADPNSGYGCTIATDDMRYSNFTGYTFDDRQLLSSFRQVAAPLMPLALQRGVVVLEGTGWGRAGGLLLAPVRVVPPCTHAPGCRRPLLAPAPAQHQPRLLQVPSKDVNCWADPGAGCYTPFGATVLCQGPNPYSSGRMYFLSLPGPCKVRRRPRLRAAPRWCSCRRAQAWAWLQMGRPCMLLEGG
jgi:hypothetical protein